MVDPRAFVIYALMEAVVHIIFYILNKQLLTKVKEDLDPALNLKDVLKGILERLVIIIGLIAGYPQTIVAFGALKIGTRIKGDIDKVSNDYFLVGNLISILAAVSYAAIATSYFLENS